MAGLHSFFIFEKLLNIILDTQYGVVQMAGIISLLENN